MLSGLLCISLRSSDLRALCGPIQSRFIFQREKKNYSTSRSLHNNVFRVFSCCSFVNVSNVKGFGQFSRRPFLKFSDISLGGFFFFGKHADVVDERIL